MATKATAETADAQNTQSTNSPKTLGEYADHAGEEIAEQYGVNTEIAQEKARDIVESNKIIQKLTNDNRAQAGGMMDKGVDLAVGVLVVGLLTAYLLPIALDELNAVDTTSWGNAESELFGLLGLFFVLAILLFVVNKAKSA